MHAQVLRDLIATLRNAETQLQQRLARADRTAATTWARQTLVHAAHASDQTLRSLEAVDRDLAIAATAVDTTGGRIAYSVEPLVRRISSPPVGRSGGLSRSQREFEAIAALLRCTHLRIADLTLLRIALRSRVPLQEEDAEPSALKIGAMVEDAYLSAERLRDYAVRLLSAESETGGGPAPQNTCARCRHWLGDRQSGESLGLCGHPDLEATGLMVSRDSGCRRYTAE